MQILVKSSNGITTLPLEAKLLSERRVFVEGEITAETACEFVKQVMFLNVESTKKPIEVLVNSAGGEINAGMLMYDVIQSSEAPIRMYCIGRAFSMGALLIACGNHGRYILPHGEMMIHEPLLLGGVGGSSSSIKSISDNLQETKRRTNEILVKHTGRSMREVEEATSYDHYLSPEESVKFGLCDEIVTFDQIGTI